MTLVDSGAIVAILNSAEDTHELCTKAMQNLVKPAITTWPCLTEALYLLGKYVGYRGQDLLLQALDEEVILLHLGSQAERQRIRTLVSKYRDAPMDFADASLVAAAETLGTTSILTLDQHFYAYLVNDRKPFQVLP